MPKKKKENKIDFELNIEDINFKIFNNISNIDDAKKIDSIFNNNYNTGELDVQYDTNNNAFLEKYYDISNNNENEDDISKKKLNETINSILKNSKYGELLNNLNEKFNLILVIDMFIYIKENIKSKLYFSNLDILVVFSDYIQYDIRKIYMGLPLKYQVEIIKDLEIKYKVLNNNNLF